MTSVLRRTYLVTNSLATSRRLVLGTKSFGLTPMDTETLFETLYGHPAFFMEIKKVISLDGLETEAMMLRIQAALPEKNYFKKALEIKGIRKVVAEGLQEMSLSLIETKHLEESVLENTEKQTSLKELYDLYAQHSTEFTYPKMLKVLSDRIEKGQYDEILSEVSIKYCKDLELKGVEKKLFELMLKKTPFEVFGDEGGNFETTVKRIISQTTMRSKITEDALVADTLNWMLENKLDCSVNSILALDYDKYAPILYHLSEKYDLPIYLAKGLKCSEFSFYEKALSSIMRARQNQKPLESVVKWMFAKGENELEDVFLTKAAGITRNIIKHGESLRLTSTLKAYDLLVDKLSSLSLSAKELGQDETGMFIGQWSDFPHLKLENLTILGLDASHYPLKGHINALLADDERKALNQKFELHLETSDNLVDKEVLEKIIANVSGKLYLGLISHSKDSGKVRVPSSLFNKILNYSGKTATLQEVYNSCGISPDLLADLDTQNPFVNISSSETILANIKEVQTRLFTPTLNQDDFGEIKVEKLSISATRLENFFKCPFKHYLEDLCKIKAPELEEENVTFWLDAMSFGTYVHGVYQWLLDPFLTSKLKYPKYLETLNATSIDAAMIKTEVEEEFENYRPEVPRHIKDALRQQIKLLALSFIEREKEYALAGFYPVSLEEDFKDKGVNLVGVAFTGKIDRLDTNGNGAYRVIDYKTGRNWHKDEKSDMFVDSEGYVHLQHGLYSVAARCLLGEKITSIEAGFYFATDNGQWERVMRDETHFLNKFQKLVELYKTQVQAGKFYKNPESCKNCKVKTICYNRPKQRAGILSESEQIKSIRELLHG